MLALADIVESLGAYQAQRLSLLQESVPSQPMLFLLLRMSCTSPQPLHGYGVSSGSRGESGYAPTMGSIVAAILNRFVVSQVPALRDP